MEDPQLFDRNDWPYANAILKDLSTRLERWVAVGATRSPQSSVTRVNECRCHALGCQRQFSASIARQPISLLNLLEQFGWNYLHSRTGVVVVVGCSVRMHQS
eukprot:4556850-Amphidinium_carterae.2